MFQVQQLVQIDKIRMVACHTKTKMEELKLEYTGNRCQYTQMKLKLAQTETTTFMTKEGKTNHSCTRCPIFLVCTFFQKLIPTWHSFRASP